MFERFKTYLGETRVEMKKVTWPTQKETVGGTVSVVVVVAVIAVVLGLVDYGLSTLMTLVLP